MHTRMPSGEDTSLDTLTPSSFPTCKQAVNLAFQGAYPPALTGAFITAFSSAMPNNLNKGVIGGLAIGLEVFYCIGAAFVIIGTPIFMVAKRVCVVRLPETDVAEGQRDNNGSVISASVVGSHVGSFTAAAAPGSGRNRQHLLA